MLLLKKLKNILFIILFIQIKLRSGRKLLRPLSSSIRKPKASSDDKRKPFAPLHEFSVIVPDFGAISTEFIRPPPPQDLRIPPPPQDLRIPPPPPQVLRIPPPPPQVLRIPPPPPQVLRIPPPPQVLRIPPPPPEDDDIHVPPPIQDLFESSPLRITRDLLTPSPYQNSSCGGIYLPANVVDLTCGALQRYTRLNDRIPVRHWRKYFANSTTNVSPNEVLRKWLSHALISGMSWNVAISQLQDPLKDTARQIFLELHAKHYEEGTF